MLQSADREIAFLPPPFFNPRLSPYSIFGAPWVIEYPRAGEATLPAIVTEDHDVVGHMPADNDCTVNRWIVESMNAASQLRANWDLTSIAAIPAIAQDMCVVISNCRAIKNSTDQLDANLKRVLRNVGTGRLTKKERNPKAANWFKTGEKLLSTLGKKAANRGPAFLSSPWRFSQIYDNGLKPQFTLQAGNIADGKVIFISEAGRGSPQFMHATGLFGVTMARTIGAFRALNPDNPLDTDMPAKFVVAAEKIFAVLPNIKTIVGTSLVTPTANRPSTKNIIELNAAVHRLEHHFGILADPTDRNSSLLEMSADERRHLYAALDKRLQRDAGGRQAVLSL